MIFVIGGSGFLGQHLIKELQGNDDIIEIRVLDLHPYCNKLGHSERKVVKSFVGDLVVMNDKCNEAFKNVSTVFHCAAFVSYEFPSDGTKLHANVQGTKNVINECLKNQVHSLIYTSTAEVCMRPYFRNGFFSVIVNMTESKIPPPADRKQLIFGAYAESKLIGEELVLAADNKKHFSGEGKLRTVALRPTFMFGEEDKFLIPSIINISNKLNNQIWRIGGPGGRHQFAYVGNVAWAHICANKILKKNANSIGGLAMFVTDDSNVCDLLGFCQKLCTPQDCTKKVLTVTSWYIPLFISFLFFLIFEWLYQYLSKIIQMQRLPFSFKSFAIYLGSVIFFSRLRAIIHLDYVPIYKQTDATYRSRLYYNKLLQNKSELKNKYN